ncbi:sensor histidine kinase [Pseudorhodoferax sp.]|uniref:sensor histidine kinase n=1 Tax=Pseudorhodoferax sp. TaxID=1993553 RepID=UPI002DD6B74F|nr:HAMP domain-containing sensor histidine kinase [Pseudorhodoferax sp.]
MSPDATPELQALRAQLAAAHADVEDFARMVSHDLRAPLRHVMAYGEVLREMLQAGEDVAPALAQLDRSSRQLGDMLDAVVALVRLSGAPLQPGVTEGALLVDEARRLAEAAAPAADRARPIHWQIAPGLPSVPGDAAQLRQALAALLANALKFTRPVAEPRIEIDGAALPGGGVQLRVHDNGVGFAPTQAARLFQPFARLHGTRFEGLGTGLAQVQQIVRRHGGSVRAESQAGHGCTVWLTLPRPGAAGSGTSPA